MATAASEAVPTPASTMTGTRTVSRMILMLYGFRMPAPEPIGAPSGMTTAAPASSSFLATTGSSFVYGRARDPALHRPRGPPLHPPRHDGEHLHRIPILERRGGVQGSLDHPLVDQDRHPLMANPELLQEPGDRHPVTHLMELAVQPDLHAVDARC